MEKELMKLASDLFTRVGQTEEGRFFIDDYEHVYQFEVDGKPEFYIELNRGVIAVKGGVHNKGEYGKTSLRVSMVKTDSKTLRALLKGKLRALDASKQGAWVIQVVSWGDQLLYTLFRIGREIIIEDLLAAQT
jgi:hypothetical protein